MNIPLRLSLSQWSLQFIDHGSMNRHAKLYVSFNISFAETCHYPTFPVFVLFSSPALCRTGARTKTGEEKKEEFRLNRTLKGECQFHVKSLVLLSLRSVMRLFLSFFSDQFKGSSSLTYMTGAHRQVQHVQILCH